MDKYQKVAMHGLIKKDGKYLVLHRSSVKDYMPGLWDIPGGTVEFGEDHNEALAREVLEETVLKIKPIKPIYIYSFISNHERHQFQIVYECEYLGEVVKLNPEEHDEFKWVSVDEIGKLKKIAFLENLYKDVLTKK